MNAPQILSRILSSVTAGMHKARQKAVEACALSLMNGSALTVTAMGRGIKTSAMEKHSIKRADRLCSNAYLQQCAPYIYCQLTMLLMSGIKRPVIQVDWSDLDPYKRHFLLRASIAFEGRALTLYEEVHPLNSKEKPKTHRLFLRHLHAMLPTGCCPIIVTDAGFKVPWFKAVIALGWDVVGRVRGRTLLSQDGNEWRPCKELFSQANTRPRLLSGWSMTRSNPWSANLVLYKGKAKGRHALNRKGTRKTSKKSETAAKREREPWLLVTTLPVTSKVAKSVVKIYASRMQIEESFRDQKSTRFGLGMELHGSRSVGRLIVMILLATLSHIVLCLIGLSARQAGHQRRFQANTVRHRAVLSTFYIGKRIMQLPTYQVERQYWRSAIRHFQEQANSYAICWAE